MNKAWYQRLAYKAIRLLGSVINLIVLLLFLIGIIFSVYAVWDSQQLYQEAEPQRYEQYKPASDEKLSFTQLQELNPDVFGWLTVYGTNIDYPLVKGEDNVTYLNTGVSGEKILSGSIFLDYRNQQNFADFNSIIYGHHMDKKVMFGEIGDFANEEYFEQHKYGTVYFDGDNHGLEFFAFLQIDAYDRYIYLPAIEGEANQQVYLDYLLNKAMYVREIEVSSSDHLVLLSTCTSDITNGRHILVGKLNTTVYEDPFGQEGRWKVSSNSLLQKLLQVPAVIWVLLVLVIGIFLVIITRRERKNK